MIATLLAPRNLQVARQQLVEMRFEGRQEITRLMALAECSFRLAVHPDTPAPESIQLLGEAVKIDGANPKYAYHLGRVYFLQGRFREAARWFRLACCLAPTSHRIWAHVAVLLRELNGVYYGDERYEPNVLAQRAKCICEAIQRGEDNFSPDWLDFIPPRSLAAKEKELRDGRGAAADDDREVADEDDRRRPSAKVRRYLHARRTRWSGVDHLYIEQVFEGRATQANVHELLPVLTELARCAPRRPGGAAGFAIVAIQWLLSGYPVQSIRRLAESLPAGRPSRVLIDLVCCAFELPLAEVPRQLAAWVEQGKLPPTVAALIHGQRLLWQPLEFRQLNAYRAARRLVAQNRIANGKGADRNDANVPETVRDLIRALERAVTGLAGAPAKPLQDEVPRAQAETGGKSLVAQWEDTEATVNRLVKLKEEAFLVLKDGLDRASADMATAEALAQCVADAQAANTFVSKLADAATNGLQRLPKLVAAIADAGDSPLPDDFSGRSEACTAALQGLSNLGKFAKVLKRIEKRLAEAAEKLPSATACPSAEWAVFLAAVDVSFSEETNGASDGTPNAAPGFAQRLAGLETAAGQVEEARKELSEVLRGSIEPVAAGDVSGDAGIQLAADHRCLESLLELFKRQGERGLEQIAALRQEVTSVPPAELPADLEHRLETITNLFRGVINVGGLRKRIMRIGSKVTAEALNAANVAPSAALQRCHDRVAVVFSDPAMAPQPAVEQVAGTPAASDTSVVVDSALPVGPPEVLPPKPRPDLPPNEQLQGTLARVDAAIGQAFRGSLRTFEPYPEWMQALPAFDLLKRRVLAQMAEANHRLGHRRKARVLWNGLLRTNRLDLNALKNIAVCDTIDGDIHRSLVSWREYLEMLYAMAALGGSLQAQAQLRAEVHRAFGNSYAPGFLSAEFDQEWKDKVEPAALISFLSSPARVRNYIDHRLLEYFNSRFEFESPSLRLGIKRVEAEHGAEDAAKTMAEFVAAVSPLIPGCGAKHVGRMAAAAIEAAAAECRDRSRLTIQAAPTYQKEEKRQVEVLARLLDVKIKLVVAFRENVNMVKNITSFDFLRAIGRLDVIPVKISRGLFPLVANAMRMDAETLEDLTATLRQNIVARLIEYLLADMDPVERPVRQRQYELLTAAWLREEEFQSLAQLVEYPSPQLMPREAAEILAGENDAAMIELLDRWHADYPAMASLAIRLAKCLIKQKRLDEARVKLEQTLAVVLREPTRRHLHYMLGQLLVREIDPLIEAEDYDGAFRVALRMVDLDDFQPDVVTQALQLYVGLSRRNGRRHHRLDMSTAVDGWLERAAAIAVDANRDDEEFPLPTKQAVESVREAAAKAYSEVAKLAD